MTPEKPDPPAGPPDAETDPRFPSGKWIGFWTHDALWAGRPRQELILTFRQGEMSGEGFDLIGRFLIRGFYSTEDGQCRWTKRYIGGHDVFYKGFNEGKGIWGKWEIELSHGGFHIWPDGMADPTNERLEAEADLPVEPAAPAPPVGEPAVVG